MGYSTEFSGAIEINPSLSLKEREFLILFSLTRRVVRTKGPYYVGGSYWCHKNKRYVGDADGDVIDSNQPPMGQPSLWCDIIPNENGTALEWTGSQKSYEMEKWIKYFIDHFVGDHPFAALDLPFLTSHKLNGTLQAFGQDDDDRWDIVVQDNKVTVIKYEKVYVKSQEYEVQDDNPIPLELRVDMYALRETDEILNKCCKTLGVPLDQLVTRVQKDVATYEKLVQECKILKSRE